MTPFPLRSIATATLALLIAAGVAAAQVPSPVLNTLEVQKLVASSEPGDHATLRAHFSALADRYAADAARHEAMARSFVGNPNRNTGAGLSMHCRRLAELNNESAATLRELAAHHEKLAAGADSTPPRDSARFQTGEGASEPTERELTGLAARARTPADHGALAEYFRTQATRYTTTAREHATMAQTYRGTRIAQAAAHCDRLVRLSRESAAEATAAAEMHRQLAGID